jgi:hypothetical protein
MVRTRQTRTQCSVLVGPRPDRSSDDADMVRSADMSITGIAARSRGTRVKGPRRCDEAELAAFSAPRRSRRAKLLVDETRRVRDSSDAEGNRVGGLSTERVFRRHCYWVPLL